VLLFVVTTKNDDMISRGTQCIIASLVPARNCRLYSRPTDVSYILKTEPYFHDSSWKASQKIYKPSQTMIK